VPFGEKMMASPATLEAAVRAYAAARRLGKALELRWVGWARDDAEALLELAQALGLGSNQLADFMTWLEEIAARDQTTPAAVLSTADVRGILTARLGRADKLKRVKTWLRARRYPRLTAIEKALETEVQALGLGDGVTVRFPLGLDGNEVTVEVCAREPDALRRAVERLGRAVSAGGFDRVFQLLDEAP
jgi:hypothetical protein